tara:strand:+ start:1306 stop:1902 length:597 start_codon:yes stop_codon:yes gene_type:complete
MKIDIQDVLFWMDAIRNSEDRYRTLESFWKGQVNSKIWLVERLEELNLYPAKTISIHGGWNGVLASLLFNSKMNISHITSLDIDPNCKEIATTINKNYEMSGRFNAVTADMCTYTQSADVVINTSCEHITQEQYTQWLGNVSADSLIVLQSNNYFELDEHIRCAVDVDDFIKMSNINPIWSGTYNTRKYQRYMIIGRK